MLKRFVFLAIAAALAFAGAAAPALARDANIIIRDTEIEDTLKEWTAPLVKAAGLPADSVKIILVQSPDINAFVAGGSNIFIYTGLIQKSNNPGEIVGVLAHEIGHISGGHLVRGREMMERASYESIVGMLLGLGAAVATGEGGAAAAVGAGTQSMAMRRFMANSRVFESSADQAALSFLSSAGMSPRGLVSFMERLSDEELLPQDQQTQYVLTHPLSRDRVAMLETGLNSSPYKDKPDPAAWTEQHARIKAKLLGFISPEQVSWTYRDQDKSIAADYARTIALYRNDRVQDALRAMDALLAREPGNAYFLELKGQMLMDFGRVRDAVPVYKKAVDALPQAALIRSDYGHALMETAGKDPARLQEAITNLERAAKTEDRSTVIQRLLATAYGRLGQDSMARLHLAEEALLQRRYDYARNEANPALKGLKKGSRAWLRAQDILNFADQLDRSDDTGGRDNSGRLQRG